MSMYKIGSCLTIFLKRIFCSSVGSSESQNVLYRFPDFKLKCRCKKLLTHISEGHFNLSNAELSRSLLQLQVTTRLILVKQYIVCQCVVVILCSKECCICTRRVIDAACICRGNVNNMVCLLPLDCIHLVIFTFLFLN